MSRQQSFYNFPMCKTFNIVYLNVLLNLSQKKINEMSCGNNSLLKCILFPLQSTKRPVKGKEKKKETSFQPKKSKFHFYLNTLRRKRERERGRGLGAGLDLLQVHIL